MEPIGGSQLEGKKVAVVGMGGIGRTFADMGTALGMRVAGWNRTPMNHPSYVEELDDALLDADLVSVHLALNDQTTGMLDRRRLNLVKRGAILINTARAEIVDEEALLEALLGGQLGHAALDVFRNEPLTAGHIWAGMQNVTLTAHAAYMTEDAYVEFWKRVLAAVDEIVRRGRSPN